MCAHIKLVRRRPGSLVFWV